MTTPSISILIRLYNGIEYLNDSLYSVLAQSYSDWEVLIGVNGHGPSNENNIVYERARQICESKKDSRIRLINYPDVRGGAEVMNALAEDAKAEWVAILDVDDRWHPQKLDAQIQLRDNYIDKVDVIGTFCQYFGEMGGGPVIPGGIIDNTIFRSINPIINSSVFMRRSLLKCIDRYNLDDYDLWCRLSLEGKTFFNIPIVLTYHRIHSNSHYNSSKKQDPEALRTFHFGDRIIGSN
jgi:glycosyltransferase involved in cell wall biosynthesis